MARLRILTGGSGFSLHRLGDINFLLGGWQSECGKRHSLSLKVAQVTPLTFHRLEFSHVAPGNWRDPEKSGHLLGLGRGGGLLDIVWSLSQTVILAIHAFVFLCIDTLTASYWWRLQVSPDHCISPGSTVHMCTTLGSLRSWCGSKDMSSSHPRDTIHSGGNRVRMSTVEKAGVWAPLSH